MKKYVIAFVMLFFACSNVLYAQDGLAKKERSIAAKEERKLQEENEKEQERQDLLAAIKDSSLVLEATVLRDKRLKTYNVSPGTNFIKIDGDELVIQTSNPAYLGRNGLGGVTIVGDLISYEVEEIKKGENYNIKAELSSVLTGHTVVQMYVSTDGITRARVTDSWGNRITFQGQAKPFSESSVFQGQESFL